MLNAEIRYANHDLPKVRKKSRASLTPVVPGSGRELAVDEALPLS
jgi:hypothetical protein